MAELVLSALLHVIFEKLASAAVNKIARSKEIHTELKKWKRKLSQIEAFLEDASQKEVTKVAVKQWLNDLQHLAYDIEDILDALATDAMHHEFTNESEGISSKVRKLIPTCCTNFSLSTRIDSKLNSITTRLQELIDEKNNLGLTVKDGGSKNKNRNYQTSLVDASSIVGREGDKKELLQKLLGNEPCSQNFSVVPIVGMGGMGKTTLARLLYDDKQVKDHFDLKAWVCVSDDFDSFNISKVIFQSIGGDGNKNFADLNLLQAALKNQLTGKRFLLVLDDIWSEKLEDWETLVAPFFEVAPGSKIIITTRKTELLRKLGHKCPYDLQKLSHNDAFSLFARHAGNDFESYPTLRLHGEGIVKKCDGLPLALKALGSLLRTKTDEEDWKQLLTSEIWMLKDGGGIVPALRLSYHDLSARLKQLFAYCCLIPKDHVFEKNDLILWWMAEGFLHNSTAEKSMERLGEECFQELLSRSFFQHVPHEESLFVMHDLMNDLATFVAGEFFVRLDLDGKKDVMKTDFKKFRHMSFVCENYNTYNKFKAFEKSNSLRTFLAMPNVVGNSWQTFSLSSKILVDTLPQLPLLRVLSLSRLMIKEVPECVGGMKQLRYLNLSQTDIRHLPESVCNLHNLQTLIVSGCDSLTTLPDNFLKLKNLRHFDIRDTLLWNMMMRLGISEMKSLQILYISGLSDEVWRGVMEYLGAVEELSIFHCNEIRYLWESEAEASKVLVNLRKLQVENCSKLVSLGEKEEEEDGCNQLTSLRICQLRDCKNLERCNLPNNIQELSIRYCPMIASVSFPTGGHKLKSLKIDNCEQLLEKEVLLNTSMPLMLEVVCIERWENLKSINELTCFIHLTELSIEDCSSIESFPAADLPNLTSLKHLTIRDCKSMDVDSFGLWPPNLGFLRIGGLKKPISKFGPQNFPPSLVHLTLYGGSAEEEEEDVTSGSQLSHMLPSYLTTLWLMYFEKLESVSVGLQHLTSLQHLLIDDCPKMKDLPEELLPSLLSLTIYGCTDELKEKTSRRGSYWPRISYIPNVDIW